MSSPLARLFALENFGIKLGLQNIETLCAALGHPERTFTSLHVAGTNGKGSVTATAHAALMASGIRSARYSSPHLVDLSERFVIGDAPVDNRMLAQVAGDVLELADDLRARGTLTVTPTFFEVTTAMAFEMFRRSRIDAAVIEVGLGGRFDATNVITPAVCAITTIGMDHQQHLGSTLPSIAFEKAGIIKAGVPVVVGDMAPEALDVIRHVAEERGAPLVEASADVEVEAAMEGGRARLSLKTSSGCYGPVLLSLRGTHQIGNALVAVRLLEHARVRGLVVPPDAIETALAHTEWPARLELIAVEDGRHVLLDAAHNADGAQALAAYLQRWHPERPALVISVMRDKDLDDILAALVPVTSHVVATQAPSPRAVPVDELAACISAVHRRLGRDASVTTILDPLEAIAAAVQQSETVCVAGSIFLAGAVRDALTRRAILH